ncbi:MAG TPA: threonine-phosphate decarboxylase CobD [Thermoanaerobaculia bacterium]|jgi:threonine-phosphate decarboxylase
MARTAAAGRAERLAWGEHGGSPERELRRFGIAPRPLLDFSVNTSPLGPPPRILAAWPGMAGEIERYPSVSGEGIRHFYERRFHLPPERVLGGNGATELLYLVPRVLRPARVAVVIPSYADYRRASHLAGAETFAVPLAAADGWAPPPVEDLARVLSQADALLLGNPNNPTGTLFPAAELLQLAREFPRRWLWIDESFIQLTDGFPQTSLAFGGELPPNVLVFHSLTKLYALPGLRLGAVIGSAATIARLRLAKEPWTVNRIAERAARLLAECRGYEEQVRALVSSERRRLAPLLGGLRSVSAAPTQANFFLARWLGGPDLDDLLARLLEAGLCVRDCRNFPGLEDGYFRFAVRRPEENDRLLAALASAGSMAGLP